MAWSKYSENPPNTQNWKSVQRSVLKSHPLLQIDKYKKALGETSCSLGLTQNIKSIYTYWTSA